MKRKSYMIAFTIAMAMSMAACGKAESNSNVEKTITVETEGTEEKNSETQENVKETEEKTEKEQEEIDTSSIGKVRTALSDTNVVPSDKNNLPAGVAPEFTYFNYENGTEGMLKAQQYLEQIGVSKENEKLVVLWYQDNRSLPILIDEYTFDENTIYCVSHSFSSSISNYKTDLENYGEESIDYTDEDAYYIRTVATQEPVNMLRSYDTFLESLNKEYKVIVW